MARASRDEISNFDQSKELTLITQQGRPKHWPPVARVSTVQVTPAHAHEPAPGSRQVVGHVDLMAAREADAVVVEELQEEPEPEPEPEGVEVDGSGQREAVQEVPLVPVAVQKDLGVPPEETVTLADQRQGVPPPVVPDNEPLEGGED